MRPRGGLLTSLVLGWWCLCWLGHVTWAQPTSCGSTAVIDDQGRCICDTFYVPRSEASAADGEVCVTCLDLQGNAVPGCSGRGTCRQEISSQPPVCICADGFVGPACEFRDSLPFQCGSGSIVCTPMWDADLAELDGRAWQCEQSESALLLGGDGLSLVLSSVKLYTAKNVTGDPLVIRELDFCNLMAMRLSGEPVLDPFFLSHLWVVETGLVPTFSPTQILLQTGQCIPTLNGDYPLADWSEVSFSGNGHLPFCGTTTPVTLVTGLSRTFACVRIWLTVASYAPVYYAEQFRCRSLSTDVQLDCVVTRPDPASAMTVLNTIIPQCFSAS